MNLRNLQIYRLPANYAMSATTLIGYIKPQTFVPCGESDAMSQGWVPPRPNGELVHSVNKQLILCLCTQTKVLPASVVNVALRARAAELEEKQGFAPGKKAMRELKDIVTDELLTKAFKKESNTWVWIDPVNGWLVVDSATASKADSAIKLLLKAIDRFPLESLRVQRSPAAAMTEWLAEDEAPSGFTLDSDATLCATGESKATVTYKRHTLEQDDMARHIAAGKQCLRLAMTWDSKISFVLSESLAIKSIKLLDVLKDSEISPRDEDERFDGNAMLMTGELAKMIAELVERLGGFAAVDNSHTSAEASESDQEVTTDADGIDVLYEQAVSIVLTNQRASISLVQRRLLIGFNRAASLLEAMEVAGVVSAIGPSGNRDILPPYNNNQKEAA